MEEAQIDSTTRDSSESPVKQEETKTVELDVVTDDNPDKPKDETETNDPNEWIRENIIQKNNISRTMYLSRLGIKDSKVSKEMLEEFSRMMKSDVSEDDTKDSESDEKSLKLENTYSSGDFSLNFLIKSDDEVRKNFIDRLTSMRLIKKETTKKHQSRI